MLGLLGLSNIRLGSWLRLWASRSGCRTLLRALVLFRSGLLLGRALRFVFRLGFFSLSHSNSFLDSRLMLSGNGFFSLLYIALDLSVCAACSTATTTGAAARASAAGSSWGTLLIRVAVAFDVSGGESRRNLFFGLIGVSSSSNRCFLLSRSIGADASVGALTVALLFISATTTSASAALLLAACAGFFLLLGIYAALFVALFAVATATTAVTAATAIPAGAIGIATTAAGLARAASAAAFLRLCIFFLFGFEEAAEQGN